MQDDQFVRNDHDKLRRKRAAVSQTGDGVN
jgi:hypothetical protein